MSKGQVRAGGRESARQRARPVREVRRRRARRRAGAPGRESNPAGAIRRWGRSVGVRAARTLRQRFLRPLVLRVGHQRAPRERALSSLRLFALPALRARSARSASVRLVITGASTAGACPRSLGSHPGGPLRAGLSGSPAPPAQPAHPSAGRTGEERQPAAAQAAARPGRGGPGRASSAADRSTRQRPCMSSAHADLPQVAGIRLHRRSVAADHRSRAGKSGASSSLL